MKRLIIPIFIWICPSAYAQTTDSAQFFYNKGLEEKSAKRYLIASHNFDKAVQLKPSYKDAWLQNGFANIEMRKTDQAKACFTKANELDPTGKIAIQQLMQLCFDYRQFAKAIEYAKKCSDCEKSERIIGISSYHLEDYTIAETNLKAALGKDAADAEATYSLARTYVDMEDYLKAISFYEKAIQLAPVKNTWIYELGLLYYNLDDYKNATAAFKNAANNGYVQSNDFKENLGYASLYSGEYENGETLLMDIWTKKQNNRDILRDIAEILYKQKQYDKSLSYCQKLMELDAKDGKALYQAGLCFQQKGDKERGEQMCDKAIQLDPTLDGLRKRKYISGL